MQVVPSRLIAFNGYGLLRYGRADELQEGGIDVRVFQPSARARASRRLAAKKLSTTL
jgi:hypothetical protein